MSQDQTQLRQFTYLFRWIVLMWIGYFLLFTLVDRFFLVQQPLPWIYYALYGISGLLLLLLAYGPWARLRLGFMYPLVATAVLVGFTVGIKFFLWTELPWLPWVFWTEQAPTTGYVTRHLAPLLLPVLMTAWLWRVWYVLAVVAWITVLELIVSMSVWPISSIGTITVMMFVQAGFLFGLGYLTNRIVQQMSRQQRALEQSNQRLVELTTSMEKLTISWERNRMARELHDTLAHTLSGLIVQLETVKAYLDVEPETAEALLDESLIHSRYGLDETRRALSELRATPLDDLGLMLALQRLAESAAERADLKLSLELPPTQTQLSAAVEQMLYRLAQETVSNVVYHANASHLTMSLQINLDIVQLVISDDGVGFDPEAMHKQGHYGLTGMQERVHLVQGQFSIESVFDKGTTITAIIPRRTEEDYAHSHL